MAANGARKTLFICSVLPNIASVVPVSASVAYRMISGRKTIERQEYYCHTDEGGREPGLAIEAGTRRPGVQI